MFQRGNMRDGSRLYHELMRGGLQIKMWVLWLSLDYRKLLKMGIFY